MIVAPELLLVTTLHQALQAIAQDPTVLQGLFGAQCDPTAVANLQKQIADPQRGVVVKLGYLTDGPVQMATVGVSLGAKDEDESKQPLGAGQASTLQGLGGTALEVTTLGSLFQVSYHLTVYAANVVLGALLSYVLEAILLASRLGMETGWGLTQQRISLVEYRPDESWFPDVVFSRAVILSGVLHDTTSSAQISVPVTTFILEQRDVS